MKHQFATVQRILGALLMLFSISMLIPLALAVFYGEGGAAAFALAFAISSGAGLVAWLPVRHTTNDLKIRDGFLVVVLFYIVLGGFGSLPLMIADVPGMSPTDALFEAISGITSTGATVLTAIDTLPHAILFWRQLLLWIGGMGIIVLAVAVMPMLGVGGMQLFRAELPGPVKDAKLTPRIRETAKVLWYVYLAFTLLSIAMMWLAGMPMFDAVSHGLASIATGGFSNHDASISYYQSQVVEIVTIIAMLLGGLNFSLHFTVWRNADVRVYWRNIEARTWLATIIGISVLIAVVLWLGAGRPPLLDALVSSTFMVVSASTTTGFVLTDAAVWPLFIHMLLLLGCCIGGCGGSTSSGMKFMRFLLLFKQGLREINQLVHPNAKIPIKIGGRIVSNRIIQAVWGFFSMYVAVFIVMFLALLVTGLDGFQSFSAVVACLNNIGSTMADASFSFATLPLASKWILGLCMIMGRLEIFTLLVIFTPAFWRQ